MTWLVPAIIGRIVKSVHAANAPSRGWGDRIQWVSLDEASRLSRETEKPIMVFVHHPACPACHHLKTLFSEAEEPAHLSRHFIMVNVVGAELADYINSAPARVPRRAFYPDGDYVPRVLFFDQAWMLNRRMINGGRQEDRFTYVNPADIVKNMKRMLRDY